MHRFDGDGCDPNLLGSARTFLIVIYSLLGLVLCLPLSFRLLFVIGKAKAKAKPNAPVMV